MVYWTKEIVIMEDLYGYCSIIGRDGKPATAVTGKPGCHEQKEVMEQEGAQLIEMLNQSNPPAAHPSKGMQIDVKA